MSEGREQKPDIQGIIGSVAASENAGSPDTSVPTVKDLADRLDLLVADFGRWESYKAASKEYVEAFTTEVKWHSKIRLAVAVFGSILVIILMSCLVLAVLWSQRLFPSGGGHTLTAIVVATITGSVVVTIAVAKGAFSTLADRNSGLPMPEHIKELIDATRSVTANGP